MQTFAQWFFLTFGLRRRTIVRRTPAALQVDRTNIVALRPKPQLRIGFEVRDGGLVYVTPLANEPRTA